MYVYMCLCRYVHTYTGTHGSFKISSTLELEFQVIMMHLT